MDAGECSESVARRVVIQYLSARPDGCLGSSSDRARPECPQDRHVKSYSLSTLPTLIRLTSQCPFTRASSMEEKACAPMVLSSTFIHRHSK